MYLFLINTVFIALATFVVLKVLRFPMIRYVNSKRRKNIARLTSITALIVMIFPAWTFWSVYKESTFKNEAERFIDKELSALPNAGYIQKYAEIDYNNGDGPTINITPFGNDNISEETMNVLNARLLDYKPLKDALLTLPNQRSEGDNFEDEVRYMAELRSKDSLDILNKDQKIVFLESKLLDLSKLEKDVIPFKDIVDEVHINYEDLVALSCSRRLSSNFKKIDTIMVFNTTWKESMKEEEVLKEKDKLYKWLGYKLKLDTLVLQ